MFVRRGYHATTMRAIAQELEFTPPAIYHHFTSKDSLLAELSAIDFGALARAFLKIGRVPDPIERLRKTGEAYVEFARSHPMQYQLMFMTPSPSAPKRGIARGEPSEDAYAFLRQTCAEAIATGRLRPDLDDADTVAQMMWSTQHGIVSLQIVKGQDDWIAWRDLSATARLICDAMVRGVTAPEG
jgi:AcrR family transcriptional regulator